MGVDQGNHIRLNVPITELYEVSAIEQDHWNVYYYSTHEAALDAYHSFQDKGYSCFMVEPCELPF